MALLRLMALRSKVFKPRFTVEAAFVRMTNIPYQNDETYLRAFAESSGVKLHIVETAFNEAPQGPLQPRAGAGLQQDSLGPQQR